MAFGSIATAVRSAAKRAKDKDAEGSSGKLSAALKSHKATSGAFTSLASSAMAPAVKSTSSKAAKRERITTALKAGFAKKAAAKTAKKTRKATKRTSKAARRVARRERKTNKLRTQTGKSKRIAKRERKTARIRAKYGLTSSRPAGEKTQDTNFFARSAKQRGMTMAAYRAKYVK